MLYQYQFSKGACYSDIPFHMNIINAFVMGCNSKVKLYNKNSAFLSVFFAGEPLAYPIIPNWYSASLMQSGFTSIRYALLIPSIFVSYSLIISFYSLSFYYSRSHFVSSLSLLLLFNLSGLSFTHLVEYTYSKLTNDHNRQGENLLLWIIKNFEFTIDQHRDNDWIHIWDGGREEYWFHPITHIMLPQRASLWSMPLCYWTILLLLIASRDHDYTIMILAGILTGLTPQVQAHSFIALVQWSVTFCFIRFVSDLYIRFTDKTKKSHDRLSIIKNLVSDYIKLWGIYGLLSVAIALPQVVPYLGRVETSENSFFQFNPIWNTPYQKGRLFKPIQLWWNGLGCFAAIAIFFGWASITQRQLFMYIPSFVVFIIANFVRYQPWELDNTKIFYACWIPIATPFVATFLSKLLSPFLRTKEPKIIKKESSSTKVGIKIQETIDLNDFHNRKSPVKPPNHAENIDDDKRIKIPLKRPFAFLELLTFKNIFLLIVFVLLVFSCIASSLIHLYQWYFFPCPIYEEEDYYFGLWLAENTPINAVFISHGFPNDPVGSGAGRQLHLGYPGWVESHGLNFEPRFLKEFELLGHSELRKPFEDEKIDYVVDFKYGKKQCVINNPANVWQLVYDTFRYKVWKLRKV